MSYHGNPPTYLKTGIAVVNPLHEIQRKLNEITKIVNDLNTDENASAGVVSIEHIYAISDIIDGLDQTKGPKGDKK